MKRLLVLLCFTALAAPAHAADVARVPLGSEIRELFASPDGGAWVKIARVGAKGTIGRAQGDGSFRTFAAPPGAHGGTIGPDGRAWFASGLGLFRIDAAGATTTIDTDDHGTRLAVGPDNSMWALSLYGETATRVAADDTVTSIPLTVSGCTNVIGYDLVRAADAAMWFTGSCGLARLPPAGPGTVIAGEDELRVAALAADTTDGVWFAASGAPGGGHADARGTLMFLRRNVGRPSDVAVAPDGAAWFARGRCTLARAAADGSVTLHRAPLPASQIAFDGSGGVWLASPARLVHTTLQAAPGACDDTPPAVSVRPAVKGRISLAALREFKLRVREPARLEVLVVSADYERLAEAARTVTATRGGTLRVRPSARALRSLKPGEQVQLRVGGRDREGNAIDFSRQWTVTR